MTLLPDWLKNILLPIEEPGVGSSLFLIFMVMSVGILIGKFHVKKISLGIAGVLFAGIFAGHIGYRLQEHLINTLRDMGLILFVYAVGMQVGPSFFSSFRRDGLKYNSIALLTVLSTGLITYLLFIITPIGMDNLVGMMSGAVTNTPGLGAAKAVLKELEMQKGHVLFNNPANAYAISYPFGVLGLILMMVVSKYIFKINIDEEIKSFEAGVRLHHPTPYMVKCRVTNPFFFGKPIDDLLKMTHQKVIVSRLKHSGSSIIESPHFHTILKERDVLMLVGLPEDVELATKLVGRISSDKLIESELHTSSKIFIVTRNHAIHKTIEELDLEDSVGVHATRVYRSGLEMLASPSLVLHYGDQIKVVGDEESLKKMSVLVGNSSKHILEPQLLSIFLGIVLGIVVGSIPVFLPGLASPVKLGMAAGPLLVALVISRYGGIHTIHSYLNQSAILFMKDLGICLFFAVVGIHAGETFYETFITYNGWTWVAYGLTITMIPLMIMLLLARLVFKMNFIPLLGLMAGTYTDPAALAFSTTYYKTDLPTQAYATVYPMVTILRILVAQLLVLYFVK